MTSTPKFTVDQTVIVRDVNENRAGGPQKGTVVKVGRTLVGVKIGQSGPFAYRIEDGSRNDAYGHSWIQTEAQYADEQLRNDLLARMSAHHVEMRLGYNKSLPTDVLAQIVAVLEAPRG